MSDQVQALLNAIIAAAKARGLTQAALAESAGISSVGLSKAKGRGDIRASHLAALAHCVDLELSLTPRHSREQAVAAIRAGRFFGDSDEGVGED